MLERSKREHRRVGDPHPGQHTGEHQSREVTSSPNSGQFGVGLSWL
jgi:hypothetical protein